MAARFDYVAAGCDSFMSYIQIPFPEELPVNRDTILQFVADYLSGKLRSQADAAEMAKRALQV